MPHLPDGIQDATHTGLTITWQHPDKTPHDLTGATMTGSISGQAISGVLAITDAINGVFTWAFGDSDVDTPGLFQVQFTATYPDTKNDKTFSSAWVINRAL